MKTGCNRNIQYERFKSCLQSTAATPILIRSAAIIHKTVKRPSTRLGLLAVFTGGDGARKETLPGASTLLTDVCNPVPLTVLGDTSAHRKCKVNWGEQGKRTVYAVMGKSSSTLGHPWSCKRNIFAFPLLHWAAVSTAVTLACHWCSIKSPQERLRQQHTSVPTEQLKSLLSCPHSWPQAEVLALPLLSETRRQCYHLPWLHQCLPTHFVSFFCAPWGHTMHTDRDVD